MSIFGQKATAKSGGGGNNSSSNSSSRSSGLASLVASLNNGIERKDGDAVMNSLYPSQSMTDSLLSLDQKSIKKESDNVKHRNIAEIFEARMRAINLFKNDQNYVEASKLEKNTLNALTDLYKISELKLLVFPSILKCLEINHKYAEEADLNSDKIDDDYCRREYFNYLLQKIYNKKCQRPPTLYGLALQNICAKYAFSAKIIAFQTIRPWYQIAEIQQIRQCGDGPYPVHNVCEFAFNCGRAKMLEDNYEEAVIWLKLAFDTSHDRNKFRILALLIPMQMCRAVMPSEAVIKYGHRDMYDLSVAIRQGNVCEFERRMLKHQRTFIKLGIYLALEQLKSMVYRNFFKRIRNCYSTDKPVLETQILPVLHHIGLRTMDLGELECILSNLIFQGALKGYLSTLKGKRILLLKPKDKGDAFPIEACMLKKN